MFHSVCALAVMLLAAISLWGWGRLCRSVARVPPNAAPLDMAVGLAAVVAMGGVLNALRVAYWPVLDAIWVGGWAAALHAWKQRGWVWPRFMKQELVVVIPIACVAAFSIRYLVPPTAFNWHDDLERYFSYPVRMLATGTLAGNPLGYLGADSLGGQAFLHGMVAAHFPVPFIGSVDAVFALLLCLVVVGFGAREQTSVWSRLLGQVVLIAINPLLVNVSSTYTTALLILALVYETKRVSPGSAWLVGLLYAGLLSLKTTNAVFVVVHFIAASGCLVKEGSGRAAWRAAVVIVGGTAVFLFPWVLAHAKNFAVAAFAPVPAMKTTGMIENIRLFGSSEVYGAPEKLYTATALTALVFGILSGWLAPRDPSERRSIGRALLVSSAAGTVTYLLLIVVFAPLVFGVGTSLRYAAPYLIGTLPVVIATAGAVFGGPMRHPMRVAVTLSGFALVALFLPALFRRVSLTLKFGAPIAFLSSEKVIDVYRQFCVPHNRKTFSEEERVRLAKIQALIPEKEPVIVWTMAPFWFDFRRNPIFNTDPYGVAMPWGRPPSVRYYVWEYSGLAVRHDNRYLEMMQEAGAAERRAGHRGLEFLRRLRHGAQTGTVLYNDGEIVVFRDPP